MQLVGAGQTFDGNKVLAIELGCQGQTPDHRLIAHAPVDDFAKHHRASAAVTLAAAFLATN